MTCTGISPKPFNGLLIEMAMARHFVHHKNAQLLTSALADCNYKYNAVVLSSVWYIMSFVM